MWIEELWKSKRGLVALVNHFREGGAAAARRGEWGGAEGPRGGGGGPERGGKEWGFDQINSVD